MPSKVWTKTLFDHQRLYNIRTNSTIIQTVGSTSDPVEIQAKQIKNLTSLTVCVRGQETMSSVDKPEIGSHVRLYLYRLPKKNHEAMKQLTH
jgi:hypothetical protein